MFDLDAEEGGLVGVGAVGLWVLLEARWMSFTSREDGFVECVGRVCGNSVGVKVFGSNRYLDCTRRSQAVFLQTLLILVYLRIS